MQIVIPRGELQVHVTKDDDILRHELSAPPPSPLNDYADEYDRPEAKQASRRASTGKKCFFGSLRGGAPSLIREKSSFFIISRTEASTLLLLKSDIEIPIMFAN